MPIIYYTIDNFEAKLILIEIRLLYHAKSLPALKTDKWSAHKRSGVAVTAKKVLAAAPSAGVDSSNHSGFVSNEVVTTLSLQ